MLRGKHMKFIVVTANHTQGTMFLLGVFDSKKEASECLKTNYCNIVRAYYPDNSDEDFLKSEKLSEPLGCSYDTLCESYAHFISPFSGDLYGWQIMYY